MVCVQPAPACPMLECRGAYQWYMSIVCYDRIVTITKYLYKQSTTVYVPSSELGIPQPLFRKRVCPPPPCTKGKGAHSPAGGVWGSPNSEHRRKSLALCLLCGHDSAVSVADLLLNLTHRGAVVHSFLLLDLTHRGAVVHSFLLANLPHRGALSCIVFYF
jgi:hypothetical protein